MKIHLKCNENFWNPPVFLVFLVRNCMPSLPKPKGTENFAGDAAAVRTVPPADRPGVYGLLKIFFRQSFARPVKMSYLLPSIYSDSEYL